MTLRRLVPFALAIPFFLGMAWHLWHLRYTTAAIWAVTPLIALPLYWWSVRFRDFYFFMVFVIPMSLGLKDVGEGLGISVPSEPFILLAGCGGLLFLIREGLGDRRIVGHPLLWIVGIQHLWAFVTFLASGATLVSLKFFLARSLFLVVFFFLGIHIFRHPRGGLRFFRAYLLGFFPIILYSLIKLSGLGLARRFSPEMAEPFFDDHTIFGACLALLLPMVLLLARNKVAGVRGRWPRGLVGAVLVAVVLGLFFSFSRAAWMSVVLMGGFALLMRWKISFGQVLLLLGLMVGVGLYFQSDIVESMQQNESVSGQDLAETARSVTNVNSDESNQERVNRWSCAVRMWKDKPVMGFGPGTYETFYPDYQIKAEMTRISTKEGDRGDAHSEYLTLLSEQGTPGLIIWLLLLLIALRTGLRIAYHAIDPRARQLGRAILLGLLTYFVHGFVNSFLDLDEAASLFWAMLAMLLILDVKFVPSTLRRIF